MMMVLLLSMSTYLVENISLTNTLMPSLLGLIPYQMPTDGFRSIPLLNWETSRRKTRCGTAISTMIFVQHAESGTVAGMAAAQVFPYVPHVCLLITNMMPVLVLCVVRVATIVVSTLLDPLNALLTELTQTKKGSE